MKKVLSAVVLVNSIGAFLVILFTLFGPGRLEGSLLWIFIKLSVSVLVIAIGILTFIKTMNEIRSDYTKLVILLGGLSLVAIGSASAVWTLNLAQITSDFEGYILMLSMGLILQGIITTWYLFTDVFKPVVDNRL
jgi:hypothetical protein